MASFTLLAVGALVEAALLWEVALGVDKLKVFMSDTDLNSLSEAVIIDVDSLLELGLLTFWSSPDNDVTNSKLVSEADTNDGDVVEADVSMRSDMMMETRLLICLGRSVDLYIFQSLNFFGFSRIEQ